MYKGIKIFSCIVIPFFKFNKAAKIVTFFYKSIDTLLLFFQWKYSENQTSILFHFPYVNEYVSHL